MLKKNIPGLAAAVLTVTTGCNDKGHRKTEGVNTSESRVNAIIKDGCKQQKECYPRYFSDYFDSVKDCSDYYASYFDDLQSYVDADEEECLDALLDYLSCYTTLSCTEVRTGDYRDCLPLEEKVEDVCDIDFDEYYDYYASGKAPDSSKRKIPALQQLGSFLRQ